MSALVCLATLVPSAHADLMSTLTVNGCSSGCGSGPYGTVSVTSVDNNTVQVTLTLSSLEIFAKSGAGSPFGYNLDKSATLVAGSLTTGFATAGSKGFAGGLGTFTSTLTCTGCGNGTSPPQISGPVSFQLFNATGLTSDDFVANAAGYFFGADVGVENASGTVVGTGVVGANSVTTTTSAVPEPGSVILFGTMLTGLVVSLSRRRRLPSLS